MPLDTSFREIALRPATLGAIVLLFVLTPFVIPLCGTLLVALIDWFPISPLTTQARRTAVGMFGFGISMFASTPIFAAFYVAWVWLKVDASFSPFRVQFDWQSQQLAVDTDRGEKEVVSFSEIESLSAFTAHSEKVGNGWMHYVMLTVEHRNRHTPILDEVVRSADPLDTDARQIEAANSLDPYASRLADSLNVPIHRVSHRFRTDDPTGCPYRIRLRHLPRLWHLATPRGRRFVLLTVSIALVCFCVFACSQLAAA